MRRSTRQWKRQLREARAAAQAGDWSRAGSLYAVVATSAAQAGERDLSQQSWAQAGDALRREDRPAAAAKALRQALDLLSPSDPAAATRRGAAAAQLAGVLVDAGELIAARDLVRIELARPQSPGSRTLLQDTLAGTLLALGERVEAEGLIAALAADVPPGARIAVAFREAALHRLSGRLSVADAQLASVVEATADVPAAVGAWSAAVSERAEICLLRGDPAGAETAFSAARAGWTRAGRRAGVFRAEAGLLRTGLARGGTPLAVGLREPVAYAVERGLPLLEAELRLARGACRAAAGVQGAADDFAAAIGAAEHAGARLLEGRLRLTRRRWGIRMADDERTAWCLAPDVPWAQRWRVLTTEAAGPPA